MKYAIYMLAVMKNTIPNAMFFLRENVGGPEKDRFVVVGGC